MIEKRMRGIALNDHFAGVGKMIKAGKAGQISRRLQPSRFACYLIAQNSDPRKPEIASIQKYFDI